MVQKVSYSWYVVDDNEERVLLPVRLRKGTPFTCDKGSLIRAGFEEDKIREASKKLIKLWKETYGTGDSDHRPRQMG